MNPDLATPGPRAFTDLYRHGFARLALGVPLVRVADPAFNAEQTLALLREADARGALVALFPELGLSAYTCDDLFHQRALLDACLAALAALADATRTLETTAVIGLPIALDGAVYNCAAVLCRGRIAGIVPKSYLPNYREFYERRQFAPAAAALARTIDLCGQAGVPFGTDLLFQPARLPQALFHIEICEDVWVPIPPSSFAALAGATLLLNLSASNASIAKADYRRDLVCGQSARCIAAYAYTGAGSGESTTDLAWDGHALVAENGVLLAESRRFADAPQLVVADVDLERLAQDRLQMTTFADAVRDHRARIDSLRRCTIDAGPPARGPYPLERRYERFPYVPADPARRRERCDEILEIQTQGLVKRMRSARIRKLVIGVSGGLDSTHALLVCAKAIDRLALPRSHILAYTMPGFATGSRTLDQARRLMAAVGATAREIDIRPACMDLLRALGHPYAAGEPVYDLTFENVQAGERTNHLFRLAGMNGALVVGTSDLSELALGWSTYGVGDHMAHYHVNASVPKTLVQHLVRNAAESGEFEPALARVLLDVLATEISPELVPGDEGTAAAASEATVGPYELQDFHLYQILRFGFRPAKVAYLAWHAWRPGADGRSDGYGLAEIKRWLRVFVLRFFETSQFKRSCIANAPKVGSGGSLSPRGDWRAPSDAEAALWLADLETVPDEAAAPVGASQR